MPCARIREVIENQVEDREKLFVFIFLIGFANGIVDRVIASISAGRLAGGLLNTFDVSIVVWVALYFGVRAIASPSGRQVSWVDCVVVIGASGAFMIPSGGFSWVAISATAAYLLWTSEVHSNQRRGSLMILGATVPMFWTPRIFSLASDVVLPFDAFLVAWLIGSHRVGNALQFADGSGTIWIAPACSSVANISIAYLTWLVVVLSSGGLRRPHFIWCLAACLAVICINVARLGLITQYPQYYDLLHGSLGGTIAAWLTMGSTLGLCLWGKRP